MTRRAIAALLALALAAGCSASGGADEAGPTSTDGSTTTSARPDGTAPQPEPEPGARSIDWEECGSGWECGTLEVPVDHDDPDGPTLELALNRHRAEDPDERRGVLLVNPGGPGASGVELARSLPRAGPIGDHFDLIGFDPRGTGESTPLDCHDNLAEMYGVDPTVDGEADRTALLEESQAFVDACEQRHGDLLPFLGTTDVARDVDAIRAALGEEQINYLGYSYGTSLGQEYARLFPQRVRAMILDGVVDHAPDGIETAAAQAAGFETALDNYVAHCDDEGCGLGMDARDAIAEVVASAEEAPIPASGEDRDAGPGEVSLALAQSLYAEQLWSSLSRALRDALDGEGDGLVQLADLYLRREPDGSYPTGTEVYFAVSCLDDTWPTDPDEFLAAATEAEEESPFFGGAITSDYIRCALWPTPPKPLAPVPADIEGLAPILVVSTTGDPATPYENGVAVADQIPGAVLVTNEGEGHTIVAQGKPCIDDIAAAYLVDLELPDDGTTCD